MKNVLNQRSTQFTIVLNDSGANVFKDSSHIVRTLRCADDLCIVYIACIKHDRDLDEETQHVKTVHYHVVVQFDRVYRIGSVINIFVDLFHCNANQVSVDKCTSLVMQTRYLIHLDEAPNEKHHYNACDIITNNSDLVSRYLKYIKEIASIDDLITIVYQFPNLCELMSRIGYDNYKKYRIIIQDIRREINYYSK